ncbi:MAG: flotillin domain-containing protein, partial [Lysinibacillus sp.]
DRYAVEQNAAAEKSRELAQADAEKYRIESLAKAEAEKIRLDGMAKADAERAQGETEADIIRLRGLAEAEAKRKIAEAFEFYGQAAVLDMVVRMMPEYAKELASPLSNIDKITVVDTGGGEGGGGANKVTSYATNLMSTLQETLKETSGIDVKSLIESYAGKGTLRPELEQIASSLDKKQTPAETDNTQQQDAE